MAVKPVPVQAATASLLDRLIKELKENPKEALLGIVVLLVVLWFTSAPAAGKSKKGTKKAASAASFDRSKYAHIKLTAEEVAKHSTREDGWLIVEGKVYDVTSYIDVHPGGDSLLKWLGQEATAPFNGTQHPGSARDNLDNYLIGDLVA